MVDFSQWNWSSDDIITKLLINELNRKFNDYTPIIQNNPVASGEEGAVGGVQGSAMTGMSSATNSPALKNLIQALMGGGSRIGSF